MPRHKHIRFSAWWMLGISVLMALLLGFAVQRVLRLEKQIVTSCERGNALRVGLDHVIRVVVDHGPREDEELLVSLNNLLESGQYEKIDCVN
jgi:hypothetical protein